MKLSTHILSEVLNQTITIFLAQPTKKHLMEIIQNAENLTFGSGTANTAPAHPLHRGPFFFRFLIKAFLHLFKSVTILLSIRPSAGQSHLGCTSMRAGRQNASDF